MSLDLKVPENFMHIIFLVRFWLVNILNSNKRVRTPAVQLYSLLDKYHRKRYEDQTANHILSEFCKLAQKVYKNFYVWGEKVIHW